MRRKGSLQVRNSMFKQDVFIGRQPIFDKNMEVYAYELLFRNSGANQANAVSGDQATSQVLLNTFSEFGLDHIVGHRRAFINVTRSFLLGDSPALLPRDRVVLEILEDLAIDQAVVDAVGHWKRQGYTIALDDFVYLDHWQPLVELADIIKLDVLSLSPEELKDHLRRLEPYPVRLLAEKVETQAQFDHLQTLNFDYYQGYLLARPKVIRRRRPPAGRLSIVRLLAEVQRPGADIDVIDAVISRDATLSYKLLRYINSAFFALPEPVKSIRQALVYLGVQDIRRWATLFMLAGFKERPSELLMTALIRARMCELLAVSCGMADSATFFTLGLLSSLDDLLDTPMEDILHDLPLGTPLRLALLHHEGELGKALQCTLAYERQAWPEVAFASLSADSLRMTYLRAVEWANEMAPQLL